MLDFKGKLKIEPTVFGEIGDDVFDVADDVFVLFAEDRGDVGGKRGGNAVIERDDGKIVGHS